MAFRKGNRHQLTLDGQTIWLDSMNEEIALRRFIEQYDFSGKWLRPRHGIKHAGKYYSPDFELSINDYDRTSRALVEVKQYRRDFTMNIARRMRAVAGHYNTNYLFLYAVRKDEWYKLNRQTGEMLPCTPPQPGVLALTDLITPKRYLARNWYGRRYYQSFSDSAFSVFRSVLSPTKPNRYRTKVKRS
jgi:hypothetical protein